MLNKLCMFLLLFAWLLVENVSAQKMPTGLSPEAEKAWRETAAINQMLRMRQNPVAVAPKLKGISAIETKDQQKATRETTPVVELAPAAKAENEAKFRQSVQAYFKEHPEKGEQYNWGNLPPAQGAVAILEAQGLKSISQINYDKLSKAQKEQLFETEPTLKKALEDHQMEILMMDAKAQEEFRKKLWLSYTNGLNNSTK